MIKNARLFVLVMVMIALSACGPSADQGAAQSPSATPPPAAWEEPESQREADAESSTVDADWDAEAQEQVSPEEIRGLLQEIPYTGVNRKSFASYGDPLGRDEAVAQFTDCITGMTGWWGAPPTSFSSPAEAHPEYVLAVSFEATKWVQWNHPEETEESTYHPELNVLEPYLPWGGVKLHRHLEETAQNLFGLELRIDPSMKMGSGEPGLDFIASYEDFGVYQYRLEAFGFGSFIMPVVLSYTDIGDGYTVTCVYVEAVGADDGYVYYEAGTADIIPEDRLADYLNTELGKHTITLKNAPDGGFYYWSHILPEDTGDAAP